MKKVLFSIFLLVFGLSAMAQQSIQLRSVDKAECLRSDMTSLQASFSFSSIEAQDYQSERGTFSWLSLPNTVIGGNEGDPQIPVVNQLIAVPFGANPRIEITSFSSTDYRLADYGMKTLVPRQLPVRKDQHPEDVPFIMNEAAYQSSRSFRSEPQAVVNVVGTMRGVQLGKMTIEPVSYDPVNNTIRVFNNIEVSVHFDGADARATEDMLVKTYSPYFDGIYGMLFNGRAVRDAYSAHPDLYTTPVKMLVVATSAYQSSTAFQNWLTWKKQKGIDVDIYTVTSSTASSTIRTEIQSRYNANHPTFLVIVGDETVVKAYKTNWSCGSSSGDCINDLEYASVDGDVYHDMFMSRMAVSSTTELGNLVDKILTYEKYTMSDPSYLNKVLLIAGNDSGSWDDNVGRPTIQYALNNYYNTAHGFSNIYSYTTSNYSGCYNYLSSGVGFANYTAHGAINALSDPSFTVSNVSSLTNNDKYFWLVANCCLSANWGNSSTSPCLGEAMIRAANKGAFGYIGSIPESYWYEDYYFGVGAFSYVAQTVQTTSSTTTGMYDALFNDAAYNTLNSVPYIGNVAVTYAHAAGYSSSVTDEYYWRAYQCLGDGSVMPYNTQPAANNVSHASTIGIGMTSFVVNADAGSYVSITKNNEILGVAQVPSNGSVEVPVTGLNSTGDVMIVVTRQQRQPYIQTIQAVSLDGPYVTVDSYTPNTAHVGDGTNLSITFKNVGADATSGTTAVTLTPVGSDVIVDNGTGNFGALAANATTTVSGFSFHINSGVADGTIVKLHYAAVNGNNTWEGDLNVTAGEAVLEYQNMTWDGGFTPGQTLTLTAKFKNTGHYQATNAVATMSTTSNYITINNSPINLGAIAVDQEVSCQFNVTIAANCPETAQIPVTFNLTANGNLSAQGTETLKNACNVIFNLSDSYGDGWNGASLTVSFDDGTESQSLTFASGSSATETLEIGNGVHVTLTWVSGSYDGECSFTVSYEGDAAIFAQTSRPSAGVLYEFDCNCGAASQTFMVNVSSSNNEQGTVSGGGEFGYGQSCTVTATPAEGYMFTNWTMNGEIVSTAANYTFTVNSDMDLVANFAEGNMIGDGGSTTNNYLPTYNYYKYSLTEQIYTSAEMGSEGLITSIAFYNGGTEKTRILDLYMKSTTKSSFSGNSDWIAVSASDKVFSGSVTMTANDWTVITFSSPFVYDGTSNVVLVADDNSGAYTNSPHMACRVFDAASQAIYVYSDGTNYNPSSPSSYSGTVLSVKNQLLITKEAISTEPVFITVSVSPAQAGTVSGGGEIAFGDNCTVSVTPTAGYFFTGWTENGTVVSSDLEYSFSATTDRDLVATFVQGIEIGEFTANNSYIPSYNYYNYSLTQQIYTADEIGAAGTINWIAFYNEGVEKTRTYDFYLKATEKTSFSSNEDWVTVAASDRVFTGSVTMASDTWTIINFTTPFEYDGTSNLVLVADDNTGSYTSSPHMTCSVFNTDESQAIYIYNDNTNFDPMSPPAASTNNAVLSVKNHILLGIEANSVSSYDITVSANPANGGIVTGTNTYVAGATATLTATANEGYTFTNWTRNGVVMSTNTNYSFTVSDGTAGEYVANFTPNSYVITATAEPAEGGTVAFGERGNRDELVYDFEDGWQGWTTFQGNTTSPNSWMHNTAYPTSNNNFSTGYGYENSDGFMLSESYISGSSSGSGTAVTPDNYLVSPQVRLGGSISFYAGARNPSYCSEKFSVMVSTTDNTNPASFTTVDTWTLSLSSAGYNSTPYSVDLSAYSGMGYIAIRHFDCYDQWFLAVDNITIVEGEVEDGSISGTFNHDETCTLVATPNADYHFVNWTENGTTVSTSAVYTFTVTGARDLVANFSQEQNIEDQTVEMPNGWGWWSTFVEASLSDLETALGTYGISIVAQNGAVSYLEGYGWDGSLESFDLSQMYEINVNEEIDLTLNGVVADPANHEITIHNGWNWIGYPVQQSMSLADALSNFTPADGDLIKSKVTFSTYENGTWTGGINTLEPGYGYMYKSEAATTKTFTYPSNRGGAVKANLTTENNYWTSDHSRFANNMNVLAVVELDGAEAFDDNIEVGAFVGNECRGSVRLMRVENTGRYMAFLTIHGETGEPVSFRVLDNNGEREVEETIDLRINTVVGDMNKPYVLHANNSELVLFPNPVTKGEVFNLTMPSNIDLKGARVEVYNALGNLVRTETLNGDNTKMAGMLTAGVYTVKVTDRQGNVNFAKLVVR